MAQFSTLQQYHDSGFTPPIRIEAGWKLALLFWLGGPFLIAGCYVAVTRGGVFGILVGAFGLVFFGVALLAIGVALWRSRRRGLIEMNPDGLYLAHIGLELPWRDLGPAWVHTTRHGRQKTEEVCYVLRNAKAHKARADFVGRGLIELARRASATRPEGGVEWGLAGLLTVSGAGEETLEDITRWLENARLVLAEDPDAMLFSIPTPFTNGASSEDLAAIINLQTVARERASS